ncbi:lytic transglycosylase domain-containing protein [Marivirga sp. S37H4]|uniref:Lytic transglycosylase domain-containing protein n=1 Tax=Marivirga aurantiaca TaxID=2802615 RepID=A0A934WZK3_9BACT|nr:lytic transglycosylase domain-containing protein [Marivirga aurantiaca]MBK6265909.1 lytic transglycosylase domain-containing protein [Marivirga aurantiaca]
MSESRFSLYVSILALVTFLVIAFNGMNNKPLQQSNLEEMVLNQPISFINAKSIPLPDKIDFAGEQVPLDIPDVKERLDKELHINSYWHNNTIFLLKRANRWFPVIEPILEEYGIPDDFKYLALIESGLENVTSYAGAVGFWQILKATGKELGLEINREVDERYHPVLSTIAACKYLKKSYEKFGSWTLVAASYNRGMRGMQNALDHQKADNYYDLMLNEETSRYVFRVLAIKQIVESPTDFGLEIDDTHLYPPYSYRYDTLRNSTDLVEYALSQNTNYKTLKLYNPWLIDDELSIRINNFYVISLPKQKDSLKK